MIKLLENVSANTTGDAITADGGNKVVHIFYDALDGTVSLQGSADGTHWTTLTYNGTPAEFITDKIVLLDRIGLGMRVRAVLSGVTTSTNVNVWMAQ